MVRTHRLLILSLLGVSLAIVAGAMGHLRRGDGIGPGRDRPIAISPLHRGAIGVPAEAGPALERVGRMLRQELAKAPTVSTCLHLLRVEGQGAHFRRADPEGEVEVLSLLTNAELGRSLFGGPMLVRTFSGVRYPTLDSTITGRKAWRETHRDQCLVVRH